MYYQAWPAVADNDTSATEKPAHPCPRCGGKMMIIDTFEAGHTPRGCPSTPAIEIRIDTS
jgi:hypothetical protein